MPKGGTSSENLCRSGYWVCQLKSELDRVHMNRIGQTPQNFQYCLREYGDWLPSDRLDTMTLALNWIEYLGSLGLLVTGLKHSRPVPNPKRLD